MWFGVLAPAAARGGVRLWYGETVRTRVAAPVFPPNKSPNDLSMIRPKNLRPKNSPRGRQRLLACDQGLKNYRPPDKPTTKLEAKYYSEGSNNFQGCDCNECNETACQEQKLKHSNNIPGLNCDGEGTIETYS